MLILFFNIKWSSCLQNKVNTLKLDVAENVLELGFCPDYGICKSRQIKTGQQCSNFVNKYGRAQQKMANLAGRSTEAEKELSVVICRSSKNRIFTLKAIFLLFQDESAKQEQYFNLMEAKEKLETHASQLFEIPNCTVITCKKCDYTWHSRSEFCKRQGHVVSKTTATKRFFQCKACGKRTVAYAMYPKKPCVQCKATEFQRVAMKERKGPKLGAEALKVRGEELPFVTS
ncbi:Mcm10 and zf-primase domain containing protein [Trichuris trichiura]|uniref:Mcm10 and zf-primase domain containing protein n=1 Tax=Trichuris trichiura TaxID=36087 RepID=A0A077ZFW1_TRITR|nr:Mcm10 and zf-primase domain containing protein [Trichuris trichiura]